ncbi:unnamed protein product [Parajaminaea phylloscopi]
MPAAARSSSRRESRYAPVARRPSRAEVRRDSAGDVIEGADEEENDQDDDDEAAADARGEDQTSVNQSSAEPGPQPLGGTASMSIRSILKDYDDSIQTLETTRQTISDAAVEWAGATQDPGKKGELLERDYRDMIDAEQELTFRQEALRSISSALAAGTPVFDAVELYQTTVKEAMDRYQKKTMRQRYLHHKGYNDFQQCVWEAWNDDAMPPLQDRLPAERGDDEDEDDIAVGGVKEDFKCPLTMALLVSPMTSTVCGHSYSKEAIEGYIEQCQRRHERPQCPRAGCDKAISSATLREDRDLEKRVRRHRRKLEQREEQRRTQASAVID